MRTLSPSSGASRRSTSPSATTPPPPPPPPPPPLSGSNGGASNAFWQRRLLADRSASPVRSSSPHPLPISPLVERRIASGAPLRTPYKGRRGWVTPIGGSNSPEAAADARDGRRRSRSLDDADLLLTADDGEVFDATADASRLSRKDRPKKSRRSTTTAPPAEDDADAAAASPRSTPAAFVDRCVSKMKTLMSK